MGMGQRWDVNGFEMIVCEIAKGLVGCEIASGQWLADEAQKGMYHSTLAVLASGTTPTGHPVVPVDINWRWATYVDPEGRQWLSNVSYLPCVGQVDVGEGVLGDAGGAGEGGEGLANQLWLEAKLRDAKNRHGEHQRRVRDKLLVVEKARDRLFTINEQLKQLRLVPRFQELMNRCRGHNVDIERTAYHIWTACLCEGDLTCALHLDDKDAGHVPNFIVSLGLSATNQVVQPALALALALLPWR